MILAFDWTQLAQQIVIGLASGGVWATLAVALVLIYRSTGVINFAQGEMAMFSTFISWQLMQWGLPYWVAFVLTIAFYCGVVRVLATMKMDNEPYYKEVLKQYPIPGVA